MHRRPPEVSNRSTTSAPKSMHRILLFLLAALLFVPSIASAAELTPAERRIIEIFGPDTPHPILLWPQGPPQAIPNPPPEEVTPEGRIRVISEPTISVYLPPKEKATGRAIIMFPGGGYGGVDWVTHVVGSATCLNPEGIAVIGLKYRTCNPYPVNRDIQQIAHKCSRPCVSCGAEPRVGRPASWAWPVTPQAHNLLLAGNFDDGDPRARRWSPELSTGLCRQLGRRRDSRRSCSNGQPARLPHACHERRPAGPPTARSAAPRSTSYEIRDQLQTLGVPRKWPSSTRAQREQPVSRPLSQRLPRRPMAALLVNWLDTLPMNKP